ncbi:MAG: ABC transporter permease [Bryobacteraceae bacterium]
MRDLFSDLRYALRGLRKAPVFTLVAVLSLALGIGANAAIFTLLDQVMLRVLPVKDPGQLALLSMRGAHYGSNTGQNALSYPMYTDIRDRNRVFSGMLCRYALPLSVNFHGRTERTPGELVSGNYFDVLGVTAALGRVLTPEDDRGEGGHPIAVLSYDYWVSRFAADPHVVGERILVNDFPVTVVGVSQRGFDGVEVGNSPGIRIPVTMKKQMTSGMWAETYNLQNRRGTWVNVFGRLRPGVSLVQAKASLQPLAHSILEMEVTEAAFSRASPYVRQQFLKGSMDVLPAARGRSGLREKFSTPLWVLMTMVGVVLLIACANLANLMIARAANRQKEMALRLALGAGRMRIARQLIVESLTLAALGGAAGLLVAAWTDHLLLRFLPTGDAPSPLTFSPDARVIVFTLAISAFTGVLFGFAPALQSSRAELALTLKEQAGAVIGGAAQLRKGLVMAQVFLSLLLLIGAGLFVRSLQNLRTLDPGFRTSNLIAFSVDPTVNGYSKDRTMLFYRDLRERLAAIPGVETAALGLVRVLDNNEWDNSIAVEGYAPKPGEGMSPFFNAVSPGYFYALGIQMIAGREFLASDEARKDKVGVVNEKFAKRYFGGAERAVGRHFGFGGDPGTKTDIEIVGVIRDAKYQDLRETDREQDFVPYAQMDHAFGMTVYIRTRLAPEQLFGAVKQMVRGMDPNLPLYAMRTLDDQLNRSLLTERMVAFLAAAFGLLATFLAAVGLYGVMAYNVARRTREIGIRMALGAAASDVTWMVMREVLWLVGVGVALALPAALVLTRLVKSQLFGVTPNDPLSLIAATLGIVLVGALAGWIPAMRAMRIDPNRALRYE